MGDRYTLSIKCANCQTINEDVWYAPSSGSSSFVCAKCKKINWVSMGFVAEIVSARTLKKLYRKEEFE